MPEALVSKSLLVTISDRISSLLRKGEMTERYYNPGNLFDEVTVVMTNDDHVSVQDLQHTAGTAKLSVVNLPVPSFSRSLGWQKAFLRPWLSEGIQLARKVNPDVIRSYGDFDNGYLAAYMKKATGAPLVVSLHINPEEDLRVHGKWWPNWKERLMAERTKTFERVSMRAADWVLPVYEPIRKYAEAFGARQVKVCYNVLNSKHLQQKTTYAMGEIPHIVSVGRLMEDKNPEQLIRAVAGMRARLTIIGDGPYYDRLRRLAVEIAHPEKIEFIKALPNNELCHRLPQFDIFAVHCQYYGISKAMLEAMLTGLPVVVNRRVGEPVPELAGDWVKLCDNTPPGFRQALEELISDDGERERLGRSAFTRSRSLYAPDKTEGVYVQLYRDLLEKKSAI